MSDEEEKLENKMIINSNCWVAYCDILGFRNKIKNFERHGVGYLNVFVDNYYNKIIDELKWQKVYFPNDVFSTWFSDAFLFFTHNDSKNAFRYIHSKFDVFCWGVISSGWPLRAAIGFGQLYADRSKNLLLGSGMINAYEYAEKQNWIGSIVTPEAHKRLNELGDDLSHWKNAFTKYPVPFHQKKEKGDTLELFTSNIHYNRPDVIRAVKEMQQEAMKDKYYQEKHRIKYENTLKFFEENP
jgi:hypothetical protein